MKKLNLGCGPTWQEKYPDYEGLDINDYGQKWVADVLVFLKRKALKEVYDGVMANHFLEHFTQDELITIFTGVHRLLKPGGLFKFCVPHKDKDRAWDLRHKTFWNENTVRRITEFKEFGDWKLDNVVTNSRLDIHGRFIKNG